MNSDSSSEAGLSEALFSFNIGSNQSINEEKEATNDINTVIICANCGKEGGDNMNTCNKCDLVQYCNAACKKKHKSKHKKKCEKRAAELYDAALFEEHAPEECPICMLPLPLDHAQIVFFSCCGKDICNGCIDAMIETGGKNMKLCPFCKTPPSSSEEEEVKRVTKLMEKGNADAFNQLAGCYERGILGLPQDSAKATELYLRAGELGRANAYYNLGICYYAQRGVEVVDKKKAQHYLELAAMNGDIKARRNLGCMELKAGNHQRAYKHFLIAAWAGHNVALKNVKEGYMEGHVTKEEYANTLREYHKSQDDMKSDARDKAAENQSGYLFMA